MVLDVIVVEARGLLGTDDGSSTMPPRCHMLPYNAALWRCTLGQMNMLRRAIYASSIGATNSAHVDALDAYVLLRVGYSVHQTTVKKSSAAPKWNESFSFKLFNEQPLSENLVRSIPSRRSVSPLCLAALSRRSVSPISPPPARS